MVQALKRAGNMLNAVFNTGEPRKKQVCAEIRSGSDPRLTYYMLLSLSALITTFGLIANSPTVVIGAMLVCPLMMPIFGISLSLVAGDTRLLRSALIAETGGILLVVGASFLVGISPFGFEITREILNNTAPNLLDLIVAALAGFAGCMAIINERISPILPGIAISTSLTPPLAACGLCLAFGALEGCAGAFILFLANFLTILFVAAVTFMATGFFTGRFSDHRGEFARRFGLAAVSMALLTFFLTNAMVRLIEAKTTIAKVKEAMRAELTGLPHLDIREIIIDRSKNGRELNALAVIDAPREPSPLRLQAVEKVLKSQLGKTVNLCVQTRITRNVSASQDKMLRFYRSADGIDEVRRSGKDLRTYNIASQVIRERLEHIPGMRVADIELRHGEGGQVVIYTTVQGSVRPFPDGIRKIEQKIQNLLDNPDIRLVANYMESYEITSGVEISDRSSGGSQTEIIQSIAARQIGKQTALTPLAVKAVFTDNRWVVVAEVVGESVMTGKQADSIQAALRDATGKDITFMAFSKAEAMVRGDGGAP